MISMTKKDYELILEHAKSCVPEEACGLIAGVKNGDDKEIKKVYILTNIDHSNEHFSLDPKEQLAAVKDMRAMVLFRLATGIHIRNHLQDLQKKINVLHMTARQVI